MGDQNGQDRKGLDEGIRWDSGLYRKTIRRSDKRSNCARTVASCVNSLGVSFAHAFDAIVPSVGSSAVIVLRAINACHLEAENTYSTRMKYT